MLRPFFFVVLASASLLTACGGGSPTSPSPAPAPSLTFTITPNPVPFTGVFAGCAGNLVPIKTWVYTISIANQGNAAFNVASFTNRFTSPLLATPTTSTGTPNDFVALFGTSSVAQSQTVAATVCLAGQWDGATVTATVVDTAGRSFTTPTTTLLPSGIP